MSLRECRPLPPIDELRAEMEKLYTKNKRGTSPEDQEEIVKASWRVKKMLGFVKMKCRREEVSTVTCQHYFLDFHFAIFRAHTHISQFNICLASKILVESFINKNAQFHFRWRLSRTWSSFWLHCCRIGVYMHNTHVGAGLHVHLCSQEWFCRASFKGYIRHAIKNIKHIN